MSGDFLGLRFAADLFEKWAFIVLLPLLVERNSVLYLVAWLVAFAVIHVGILTITGTTPFKWILGLGVRAADGQRLRVTQAAIRAAVYASPVLLGTIAAAIAGWDSEYIDRHGGLSLTDNLFATGLGIFAIILGMGLALSVLLGGNGRGLADQVAGTAVVKIR